MAANATVDDQDMGLKAQQWWATNQLMRELEGVSPRHTAQQGPTKAPLPSRPSASGNRNVPTTAAEMRQMQAAMSSKIKDSATAQQQSLISEPQSTTPTPSDGQGVAQLGARLHTLNEELAQAQRAMLQAGSKQEKQALSERCHELDRLIHADHVQYRSISPTTQRTAEAPARPSSRSPSASRQSTTPFRQSSSPARQSASPSRLTPSPLKLKSGISESKAATPERSSLYLRELVGVSFN